MQKAVFRFDASPNFGGGHASRCITLANALKAKGWINFFASNSTTFKLIPSIKRQKHIILDDQIIKNSKEIHEHIGKVDLLVVDNYSLDEKFETESRSWAKKILVIDDLANRKHDCDYIIDQTFNRKIEDYKSLVPKFCKFMIGSKYALLKPEFCQARKKVNLNEQKTNVSKVLISLGATDPNQITSRALSGVLKALPNCEVDVVLGYENNNFEFFKNMQRSNSKISILYNVENMTELMLRADLSIGAGGVTSWERCCLGLPTIMIISAENQKKIAEELSLVGAVKNLGWHENININKISDLIKQFSNSPGALNKMASIAFSICDGLGVERTIREILN